MYNIIGRRKVFYVVSAVIIGLGLISLLTRGLNLGIDFTSGSLIQVEFKTDVTPKAISDILKSTEAKELGVARSSVQVTEGNVAMIRVNPLTSEQQAGLLTLLESKLGDATELATDKVDPVIGAELVRKALISVLVASLGILAYVAFRFEYRSGVAGVIALIHDVLVTLGFFSLFQIEVNSPFVAAILTVVGYSINDTIVIFDRIRENLSRMKGTGFEDLVNASINQTLKRTLYTSLTTLFPVVALLVLGASSIRDLTLAFLVGVITGTYSSIFIASAIWVDWKERDRAVALATK